MQKHKTKCSGKKSFAVQVAVRDRHNVAVAMKSSDSSGQSANSKDCKA